MDTWTTQAQVGTRTHMKRNTDAQTGMHSPGTHGQGQRPTDGERGTEGHTDRTDGHRHSKLAGSRQWQGVVSPPGSWGWPGLQGPVLGTQLPVLPPRHASTGPGSRARWHRRACVTNCSVPSLGTMAEWNQEPQSPSPARARAAPHSSTWATTPL